MTAERSRVAIIVLNWNGVAYLRDCFDALLAQDYPDLQIVLVDNDSADNSIQFTREQFPQIKIIVNERNLGFAAGNNRALQTIQADIYVLVNPDVVVSAEWLPQLLQAMESDPSIGIAGGKLHYPDGNLIQFGGGEIMPPRAESTHYGMREIDNGQCDAMGDVGYVIGAAMAIRRELFQQIGFFDEDYFLYYEDTDLCERARQAGFRVVYAPQATAIHHESAVASLHSPFYWQHFHRGRLRYALKHYDWIVLREAFRDAEDAWIESVQGNERLGATEAYRTMIMDFDTILHDRDMTAFDYVEGQEVAAMLDGFWVKLMQPALVRQSQVQPQPFRSGAPIVGSLIAGFRTAWSKIALVPFAQDLLNQQNVFNKHVATELVNEDARLYELDREYIAAAKRVAELAIAAKALQRRIAKLEAQLEQR